MRRLLLVLAVLTCSLAADSVATAGWGKYGLYSRPYVIYPGGWGRKNMLLHYDYVKSQPIPTSQVYMRPYGY